MLDFKKLAEDAESTGVDMNKAQTGGGDYKPPAAGPVQLRFFSYVECGKHESSFKGEKKVQEEVQIGFELSGPNHPPREDGTPMTMIIKMNKSLNEKAGFFGLFKKLNHAGKAKHIISLLGEAYLGTIYHRTYKRGDGSDGVAAELKMKGEGYSITAPAFVHPVSGVSESVVVAPLRTPMKAFLWDRPDMEQWASIFIDGEYAARTNDAGEVTKPAASKNVVQARIMSAKNFKGSPMADLLVALGKPLDIPNAEQPEDAPEDDTPAASSAPAQVAVPTGAEAADALNGIV